MERKDDAQGRPEKRPCWGNEMLICRSFSARELRCGNVQNFSHSRDDFTVGSCRQCIVEQFA